MPGVHEPLCKLYLHTATHRPWFCLRKISRWLSEARCA
jgi:hypothetical protein